MLDSSFSIRPIELASVVEYALHFQDGWTGDFGSFLMVGRRRPENGKTLISYSPMGDCLPPLLQLLFCFQQKLHACPVGPEQVVL